MKDEGCTSSRVCSITSVVPPISYLQLTGERVVALHPSFRLHPCRSHSVNVRAPDVFVKLQLHPHSQAAFGDPISELLQIDLFPRRRNQDRFRAGLELVLRDNL